MNKAVSIGLLFVGTIFSIFSVSASTGEILTFAADKIVPSEGEAVYFKETNLINGDFSDGENGWIISNSDNMRVEDGKLVSSGENYEGRISQTVKGTENGVYNLTAYVSNDRIDGVCYLYAKTNGYMIASTSVPMSNEEIKITVPDIIVEDGICELGLYVKGDLSVTLDDVSLSKAEKTDTAFLKGGEISRLTYVEDNEGKFYYKNGTEGDALQIMAENGFNLARIRLLNNPGKGHGNGEYYLPEGYQTEEDCMELARRAKDKGMKIVFTFAYSDTWSDGENQIIPYEWQKYIDENNLKGEHLAEYLEEQIYLYTKEIMNKLIAQGTCPEFVSIGNEIQSGMMFNNINSGNGMYANAACLARFLNAGAKAVRETSPQTKIIIHSDSGGNLAVRRTFTAVLGVADYDVIGVSYYPYYNRDISIDILINDLMKYIEKYDKDVIIMETGYNWSETNPDGNGGRLDDNGWYQEIYGENIGGQHAFLTELYAKLKQMAGGRCIGALYCDPVMVYNPGKIGWSVDEKTDRILDNIFSNSAIFDFSGKENPSQSAMKYNINSRDNIIITGTIRDNNGMSISGKVNFIINGIKYKISSDSFGSYIISIPYPKEEKINIEALGLNESYSLDVPYYDVLISNIDFTELNGEDSIHDLNANVNSSGFVEYSVDYYSNEADLYVALYNDEWKLLGVRKNEDTGVFEVVNGSFIKVFLWNGMNPACDFTVKNILQ